MPNGKNKKLTLALFWISIILLLAVIGLAIWGLVMAARKGSQPQPQQRFRRIDFAKEEKIV
jgi:hypothetical protein